MSIKGIRYKHLKALIIVLVLSISIKVKHVHASIIFFGLGEASSTSLSIPAKRDSLKKKNQFSLDIFQTAYFSKNERSKNSTMSFIYAEGQLAKEWKRDWSSFLHARTVIGLSEQRENYFSVPEAFVRKKTTFEMNLSVGRQLYSWSSLDDLWGLGLWQPHHRWNPLYPEKQGLTGVFTEIKRNNIKVMIFVSGLYIPEQGPSFEIRDGKITSSNPWFASPVKTMILNEEKADVRYKLDKPEISEVVEQESIAVAARLGGDEGLWFQGAYAYKPTNQIGMAVEGIHNLASGPNSLSSEATIHPYVRYHWLSTFELGYSNEKWKSWISWSGDVNEMRPLQKNWERDPIKKSQFLGMHTENEFNIWNHSFHLGLGYMKRWDEFDGHKSLVKGRASASQERYNFKNVIRGDFGTDLYRKGLKRVKGTLSYLHSFEEGGEILSIKGDMTLDDEWSFWLGLDVLGSTSNKMVNGFITRNRSNDRGYGGVKYVF